MLPKVPTACSFLFSAVLSISWISLALVLTSGCSSSPKSAASSPAGKPPAAWIVRSDALAKEFALGNATDYPEDASALGYHEYDKFAERLDEHTTERDRAYLTRWKERLARELAATSGLSETDSEYRIDLHVLATNVERELRGMDLSEAAGDVAFFGATEMIFNVLRDQVNEQTSAQQKRDAVDRFHAYVNGHDGFRPLLEAARIRTEARIAAHPKSRRFYPARKGVEQYLNDTADYLKGVRTLLEASGRKDWEADYGKYVAQAESYNEFVRTEILPSSRTDFRLPREMYLHHLNSVGIESTPEELIAVAKPDFERVYATFREKAKEVARKHHLKKNDPFSVMQFLKQKPVSEPAAVQAMYVEVARQLEEILRTHAIVSVPSTPLRIRQAGDAESKALPVPHLNTPPFINNHGERPEFILPTAPGGKLPFDDFSTPPVAMALTAHEGRPGHDLQFAGMLGHGVSMIRSVYAFNSVNAEGWALYAEDLVYPYEPIEAQLAALQLRLWRIARMFLDPEVQLGKITVQDVIRTLHTKLGMSETLAGLEARRYTYEMPGQAPSYYYGFLRLMRAKEALRVKLGPAFREKCFNDGVLELGLLPVDQIAERLAATLKCD